VKDFLITPADRTATGAAAILDALAGQGGTAVAGLSAMNIKEEADFVEFEINGEPVEGWLTYSPFEEGDEVELVAKRKGCGWYVLGIIRADYLAALHPCCSRGRYAHFTTSMRLWILIGAAILIVGSILMALVVTFNDGYKAVADLSIWLSFLGGGGGGFLFLSALIAIGQSRKFMPAVRLAESVFAGFGWKNVRSIDLPAITKKYKLAGAGLALGMLYFRCGKDSLDERLTGNR
jgi:hypothetical protein